MENTTIVNGQTCLESRGIAERETQLVKNDYQNTTGKDYTEAKAIATKGNPQGKGANDNGQTHGGHTDWLPNCTEDKYRINYSNFATNSDGDTKNNGMLIGGEYDINGRNGIGGRMRNITRSLYNKDRQYGANLIDTSKNEGQYHMA